MALPADDVDAKATGYLRQGAAAPADRGKRDVIEGAAAAVVAVATAVESGNGGETRRRLGGLGEEGRISQNGEWVRR